MKRALPSAAIGVVVLAAAVSAGSGPAGAAGQAERFYCEERQLGYWFYCTRPETAPPATQPAPEPEPSYQDRLAEVTETLRELKARAILEPTEENVAAYVAFQREQLDRSGLFTDVWQRLLWQRPDLDYTLKRPVSTLGKQAWLDARQTDKQALMAQLPERYGLFYFYAASCPSCRLMTPVLKYIDQTYGLHIQAVSMDGGPNPDFPDAVVDRGQSARMGLPSKTVPALVLFDTETKQFIPIGHGLLSADEILERIFILTQTKPGEDY
ncbi:MAG TPA: conjugal transfer protein TraF [Pedomonas sp.]|uniref:conjugal transfer protein TraF n=1 Tax=Pedomonas sp. TaxID=2976421 RepID=UPI002F406D20